VSLEHSPARSNGPATPGRPDYVVSERDAAKILGVSPDTLRRLVRSGEGPQRIRISARRVGYRLSAIDAFLNKCAAATEVTDR
jgi:predicted DNA-binding transcriptional regulator AlpA